MALFSFIAGVLAGVAASYVAAPLWRGASTLAHGRTRYLLAGGFVASFALIAGLFYLALGSRHSLERPASSATASTSTSPAGGATAANGAAKTMEAEVAGLEARLARDGGTPADWSLLAQAYDFMGRPEDAKRARAKAGGAAAGPAAPSGPAAGPAVWQMGASALTAAASAADTRASARGSAQGNVSATPSTIAPSAAELERRVAANPRDADSWLALAEMRRSQRDYAGARTAYVKLVELHAMSAQSWADYADVLGSLAGGSLAGEAGRAIDNALALDAANPKALWLKASQANEQHRYAEALVWWKKLRAVLPTDSPDARMVDANIAEANSLAGTSSAAPGATTAAATTAAATTATAAGSAAGAEVSGTVSLDRRFSDRVQSNATLFIYAKAADSPGPPLAVLRTTVGAWPVTFHLDDSMAMIPSRRLSQFDRVVIEARISRSGQATPAAGDLYVTSPVLRPAAGTRLALVINREIG
jgi:cytochrome c-type biogenesis protein CcmH